MVSLKLFFPGGDASEFSVACDLSLSGLLKFDDILISSYLEVFISFSSSPYFITV